MADNTNSFDARLGAGKTPAWVARLRTAARNDNAPQAQLLTLASAVAPAQAWEDELAEPAPPEQLAQRTIPTAARYVVCRTGGLQLAVAVEKVMEVLPMPRCAHVPGVASCIRGLAHVRREEIYVLDVGELLGIETDADRANERMLLVKTPGRRQPVGLAVDAVLDFTLLGAPEVSDDGLGGGAAGFVCEVTEFDGQPVRVLDAEGLLESGILTELARGGAVPEGL